MDVASFVAAVFNNELPFRVEAYDGSVALPSVASASNDLTLKILRREALTRVLTHPGELGVARAYVAGDRRLRHPSPDRPPQDRSQTAR